MSSFAAESKTEGIKLISHEGESFSVPLEVAKMSTLVGTMLTGDEEEDQDKEIPLPNVKAPILAKVIEFCKHHVTDPMTPFEKVFRVLVLFAMDILFFRIDEQCCLLFSLVTF